MILDTPIKVCIIMGTTEIPQFRWSRLFVVEPTAGRFGCRRKNFDNKAWHCTSMSVPDDSPSSTTAANDSVSSLPQSSRIVSSIVKHHFLNPDNASREKRSWLAIITTTTKIPQKIASLNHLHFLLVRTCHSKPQI